MDTPQVSVKEQFCRTQSFSVPVSNHAGFSEFSLLRLGLPVLRLLFALSDFQVLYSGVLAVPLSRFLGTPESAAAGDVVVVVCNGDDDG